MSSSSACRARLSRRGRVRSSTPAAAVVGSEVDFVDGPDPLEPAQGPWAFGGRMAIAEPSPDGEAREVRGRWEAPLVVRLATHRSDLEREAVAMQVSRSGGCRRAGGARHRRGGDRRGGRTLVGARLTGRLGRGTPRPDRLQPAPGRRASSWLRCASRRDPPAPVDHVGDAVPVIDAADEVARIDPIEFAAERGWLHEHLPSGGERVLCHGGYQPLCVFGPPADCWEQHGGPGHGLSATNWCRRGPSRARVRRGLHARRAVVGAVLRQEPVRAGHDQDDPQHPREHLQARLHVRTARSTPIDCGSGRRSTRFAGWPAWPVATTATGRPSSCRIADRSRPISRPNCAATSASSRACDDPRRGRGGGGDGLRLSRRARPRHLLGQHRRRARLDHRRPGRSASTRRSSARAATPSIVSAARAADSCRATPSRSTPTRFGIMPVAVEGAEPDQLLALKTAAAAIDDAGGLDAVDPERIGVVLGRGGYLHARGRTSRPAGAHHQPADRDAARPPPGRRRRAPGRGQERLHRPAR